MGTKVDWVSKLEQMSQASANPPEGDGWFTAEEFIKNLRIGRNRAYRLLRQKLNSGEIEKHNGSAFDQLQEMNVRRVWYRFVSDN